MANAARNVLEAALELTEEDPLEIAAELMARVGGPTDPEWERAWLAELDRRVAKADATGDRGETLEAVRARLFPTLRRGSTA